LAVFITLSWVVFKKKTLTAIDVTEEKRFRAPYAMEIKKETFL
jgi:hypothetical protein